METHVSGVEAAWFAVRRSVLVSVFVLCFGAYAIMQWVIWPVRISGDSMAPTYNDGQPNYINKLAYLNRAPERGDVVGVRIGPNEVYIKRIIGLPGERVAFDRGTILINGKPLDEHYEVKPLLWWLDPVQLGRDEYFVMGDNRLTSVLGAVPREHIIGKAVF